MQTSEGAPFIWPRVGRRRTVADAGAVNRAFEAAMGGGSGKAPVADKDFDLRLDVGF